MSDNDGKRLGKPALGKNIPEEGSVKEWVGG